MNERRAADAGLVRLGHVGVFVEKEDTRLAIVVFSYVNILRWRFYPGAMPFRAYGWRSVCW